MFGNFLRKLKPQRTWVALKEELELNLEGAYVLDQRRITAGPFELKAWQAVNLSSENLLGPALSAYGDVLGHYNRMLTDMRAYEGFYLASIENKTRANAEILHTKKEALDEVALGLIPLILRARDEVSLQ